jgi:hypothetical protein
LRKINDGSGDGMIGSVVTGVCMVLMAEIDTSVVVVDGKD